MAVGYIPLPGFRAPSGLDFSGLNSGIDALGKSFEKNRLLSQSREIGSAIQSGDYSGGAAKAFGYGDLNTGLSLANTQRDIEQDKFNRARLTTQDRRSAAADARSAELHGLNVETAKTGLHDKFISRIAGVAQTIRNETDPQRKAVLVQTFANAHPRLKTQLDAYNFDPANPDPVLDMIIAEARGVAKVGDVKFGTTPQYYRDPQTGQVKVGQLSASGGFRPTQVPGEVLPTLQFQDIGTGVVPLSRQTGQAAGPVIPKDIAGEAAAREAGKAQGEAQARYPQLAAQSEQMLSSIDSLLKDPYLPNMTGLIGGRQPNISEDAVRVQSKVDQLQSQVFLQGYERLKGGGVITDYEGQKAEQAIARISDPRVSYPDYVAAVTELRNIVQAGAQRARQAAGGGGAGPSAPSTDVNALKQKYGLE